MGSSSVELSLIELQNIIDAEFDKAKTGGKCSLLNNSLVERAQAVSVKQFELKNLLESLDVQIKNEETRNKNRRESNDVSDLSLDEIVQKFSAAENSANQKALSEKNSTKTVPPVQVAGGKDTPIVIEDEDEIKQTVQQKTDLVIPGVETPAPVNVPEKTQPMAPLHEVPPSNTRRRPLILEKSVTVEQSNNELKVSEAPCSKVPQDSSWLEPKSTPTEIFPTRSSASIVAVSAESDVSTETASSPITDPGQSSLPDDFQINETEVAPNEVEDLQEGSSNDSPLKELDRKLEISESKSEAVASVRPHSPSDFIIGTRVLGKRSSDIWFPGQIIKTMTDRNGQVKYTIKYDKGPKGVLSLNHICPEEPAVICDLSVGSRVVGLYGTLNIWYAGIVAEMSCPGNKNRVLVFFDDGFAQYLSIKKVHKVHHKGQNVWEDVIEDSRDFIQEYLEDYPSRPMLHVRVGQWIRTEWKGQWLKARVMSVDGSLVKMLFQIDNRSEWIYRGSTRLDPLYTALVMGEKTRSTKARSRKLTRNTSSKDNAPYIEYNMTKPCYGVSPYSKTDPKGIQQSQLEEQRQLTQKQHEGLKHPKQETRLPLPTTEEKPVPKVEEKPVIVAKVKPPSPVIKDTKPAVTEIARKDVVMVNDEPIIESTYSCIQASTMRKKTGASLVNNAIFKTLDIKDSKPYAPMLLEPEASSSSSSLSAPELPKSQAIEDLNKPKSTAENQWKAPWLNVQRNKQRQISSENAIKSCSTVSAQKYHDAASILKHKLDAKILNSPDTKLPAEISPAKREHLYKLHSVTVPHTCSFACSRSRSKISIDPLRHNLLALPILMDWKREVVKRRGKTNKRDVYYRTPCNRRLRNMVEIIRYLQLTGESSLNVDHFTFDWRVRTDNVVPPVAVVPDISSGQENRPLPAVNEVDGTRPPNIKYMSMRQFAPEVRLTTDPGFMVCCDCKDNCSDASKCACIQLTLQGCKAMEMKDVGKMTYQYRRLKDCIQTGIYECNSECSCTKNCLNRVVQNGIQLRLEVFKTENRGWGLRATDDIPAGTFVCTYAGYILNEELANQDGRKYGDEYMAELDYIEVAEKAKEGYESDVSDLEEDDNVVDEMLQSDDNFSYSGNSAVGSRNEDYDDDYDDVGEEEDDDGDDHTYSFDDDSSSSSADGVKILDTQKRKKRNISSEESLVVERESKANVLSRLGTPLMCILALKRNDEDLNKTSQFLKRHTSAGETSCKPNGDTCKAMNGVLPQPVLNDTSNTKSEVQCNSRAPASKVDSVSFTEVHQNIIEKVEEKKISVTTTQNLPAQEDESKLDEVQTKMDQDETKSKEETVDSKDDAPQLLSADDLQRLAASQPKRLQPPVLTRRGTVLDETIEKLKKRVVSPDLSLLQLQDTTAKTQSCLDQPKTDKTCQESKDITTSDKKSIFHGVKEDSIDHSETSSPSQNSSSLSQSASSRSSSPAVDSVNRFRKDKKGKRSSEKGNDSTTGQNANMRFLKTRSLFGEEHCYVIDATFGNCGRFLNHSCSPNLFVQNVFIDTHDMRFPWVAFFAQTNIKAGSELTWDYMYEVGSVRDKSLYCLCGSSGCRGRLL